MQAHPALVLNADFRLLSYFPLSLLTWQDAITELFKDHVSVVAEYDKWVSSRPLCRHSRHRSRRRSTPPTGDWWLPSVSGRFAQRG